MADIYIERGDAVKLHYINIAWTGIVLLWMAWGVMIWIEIKNRKDNDE